MHVCKGVVTRKVHTWHEESTEVDTTNTQALRQGVAIGVLKTESESSLSAREKKGQSRSKHQRVKALRLQRAWTIPRETFSVAGMGSSGGKFVGSDAIIIGRYGEWIKSLEYHHAKDIRFLFQGQWGTLLKDLRALF